MCGLVGFIGKKNDTILKDMSLAIKHRGPDSNGFASYLDDLVHFAHQRLAILDLSPSGAQPMISRDAKWAIIFNGEIYNYRSIRNTLNGPWKSESDTEVLVESLSQKGFLATISEIIGMFAFAALDIENKELYLVRDRVGEKPLYYYRTQSFFGFASDLNALKKHPEFKTSISLEGLSDYFIHGYIPAPLTIFKDTKKVRPGHYVKYNLSSKKVEEFPYWEIEINNSLVTEKLSVLDHLLTGVIGEQMLSDVPLGAFLSGGIDSSLVVAIMQKISPAPVHTFAIGFDDPKLNEAPYAKQIASHLGTRHHELIVSGSEALKVIPDVIKAYDEPFADYSNIPTYLVSRFARDYVKVVLTGDGGDESFGGYNRYRDYLKLMKIPAIARRCVGSVSSNKIISQLLTDKFGPYRAEKLSYVMSASTNSALYERLRRIWGSRSPMLLSDPAVKDEWIDDLSISMMREDFKYYLPDDLLVKVDRASMAHSLETRAPLLDKRIVEFARSLSINDLINHDKGKVILRDNLSKYVPRELFERPKAGFMPPLKNWLKTDLRGWAESLLNKRILPSVLNYDVIDKTWKEHLLGKADWTIQVWTVLAFLQWYENQSIETESFT